MTTLAALVGVVLLIRDGTGRFFWGRALRGPLPGEKGATSAPSLSSCS